MFKTGANVCFTLSLIFASNYFHNHSSFFRWKMICFPVNNTRYLKCNFRNVGSLSIIIMETSSVPFWQLLYREFYTWLVFQNFGYRMYFHICFSLSYAVSTFQSIYTLKTKTVFCNWKKSSYRCREIQFSYKFPINIFI